LANAKSISARAPPLLPRARFRARGVLLLLLLLCLLAMDGFGFLLAAT
jgi:hypothetical protein